MKDKRIPSFEEFMESYTSSEIGYSTPVTDEKEIEYWNELAKKNLSQQTIDKIKRGNVIDLTKNVDYSKPKYI